MHNDLNAKLFECELFEADEIECELFEADENHDAKVKCELFEAEGKVLCNSECDESTVIATDETNMSDGCFSNCYNSCDHFPKRLLAGQCGLLPWVGPEGESENTLLLPCLLGLSAGVSLAVVRAGQTAVWGTTHVADVAVAEFDTGASEPSPVAMFLDCLFEVNDPLLRVHYMDIHSMNDTLLRVHYMYIHCSNVVSTSTVFTVLAAYRDTSSGAHWQPALSSEHVGRMRV